VNTQSNAAAENLNVSEFVDTAPVKFFHILIMFLCALILIMDGFDLTSMGMVVPTLSDQWAVEQSVFSSNLISPLSAVLFGVVFGSIIASIGNLPVPDGNRRRRIDPHRYCDGV